ncbi:MAG: glycosyl hydrolase family 25, partial [Streptococcus sp.]
MVSIKFIYKRRLKEKKILFLCGSDNIDGYIYSRRSADELVSKETAITEGKQVQTEKAPEVAVSEKTAAPILSNYVAPANVTEQSVASTSTTTVSESSTPSVEKSTEVAPTEKTEETPLQSDAGSTTFFNTGSNAPASRSTDVAVQPK